MYKKGIKKHLRAIVIGVGVLIASFIVFNYTTLSTTAATAVYSYNSPIVVQNPAGATSAAAYYGDETITPSVPGTELNDLFNKKSGLGGISGFSSDIRDIIKKMNADGDSQARLAVEMYTYRLKKYIGAYAAVMGGLDVLVFTDDIGVQSWLVRQQACEGLAWCGIEIDDTANQQATTHQITQVSSAQSAVKILTIPPDEEFVIGMEGIAILQEIDHAHL